MKRRKQEINIFSMSALDLFASALGAFILIAIVLFPYFPHNTTSQATAVLNAQLQTCQANLAQARAELQQTRESLREAQAGLTQTQAELQQARESLREAQADLTQTQAELQQAQETLRQPQRELQQAQEDLQQCAKELRKKFLLVLMSWGSEDDVDLFVRDPQDNLFYYDRRTNPGTPAKFEEDNIHGPGNEVWLHPQATPGKYEICYHFYTNYYSGRNSVEVRGAYLTPAGRHAFGTVTLSPPNLGRPSIKHVVTILIDEYGNATSQRGSQQGTCGVSFGPSGPKSY